MAHDVNEFISYLNDQVKSHALYVLGGQGELVVDILPRLTDMETPNRVKEILTLMSNNLKQFCDDFTMYTTRVFDCSGLGTYYFLLHDILNYDTTADGLYKLCNPIKAADLKPGDMVFQEGTREDGTKYKRHVGYYIGSGQVVESKGRTFGVVQTEFSKGGWTHCGHPAWWESEGSLSRVLKYVKGQPIMQGEDVRLVQNRLNDLKYDCGKADGQFGKKSDKAVRAFQKDKKLGVDGEVGPKTAAALGIQWIG